MRDGATFESLAPAGGTRIVASALTFANGNRLRTTHLPGGSVTHALLTFTPSYTTVIASAIANAPGGAADIVLGGSETDFLVGTPRIRFVGNPAMGAQPRIGNARILSNDVGTDPDADGLGSSLEGELQTCPTMTGCPFRAVSGKDSDRDGLSDRDEVLGVAGILPNGVDDLPFARWGANPAHKDIFVEVDFVNRLEPGAPVPLPSGTNPFQWIRNNPGADPDAFYNGTLEDWMNEVRAPFLAGPTAHLQNPDGQPGVAVHFDIGVPPIALPTESQFGNYGASSSNAVEPDWSFMLNAGITGSVRVTINGVQSPSQVVTGAGPTQMAGVINNLISSLGQPVTWRSTTTDPATGRLVVRYRSTTPGTPFTASIEVPVGFEASITEARPISSLIPYQQDAGQISSIRRGRFRYAVVTGTGGGGQASGLTFVTGMAPVFSVAHELGHTVGIEHWGHSQWLNGVGNDCMPHYFSLMGYGIPLAQFSSNTAALPLNPSSVREDQPLGLSFPYPTFNGNPWNYAVTGVRVDWNRDTNPQTGTTNWRAPAMSLYNSSCQAFGQGRTRINFAAVPPVPVVGAVDLVRAGVPSRLYAFWSEGALIRYRFAPLSAPGNKSCTGTSDPTVGDCLTWSPSGTTFSIDVGDNHQGLTAASFNNEVFIGYRNSADRLRVLRFSINSGGTLAITNSYDLSNASSDINLTTEAPELVVLHDDVSLGALGVIYLDRLSTYRLKRWNGAAWLPADGEPLRNAASNNIVGRDGPAAKAWPSPEVGFLPNERRTVALLPNIMHDVVLYVLNYDSGLWELAQVLPNDHAGKPFLEYRHIRTTSGLALADFDGHFLIGWNNAEDPAGTRAMIRFSQRVRRLNPPTALLGLLPVGDFLSNQWAFDQAGTSAALYSDSTIDNVFGLVALNVPGQVGVWFYPHADGSPNHTYNVFSDFRIMEDEICGRLQGSGGQPCGTITVTD